MNLFKIIVSSIYSVFSFIRHFLAPLVDFTPLYRLVQLAADMQRFSRPERLVNGPTITHFWFVLSPGDHLLSLCFFEMLSQIV